MDLDLGNSEVLKKFLLPEALIGLEPNVRDTHINLIGLGVAKSFDQFCNRKFKRSTAHTDIFEADREHWFLAATPVESVTTVHVKNDEDTGWELISDGYINLQANSGRLWFGSQHGSHESLVKVTYIGGYWYDSTDLQDDTLPANATELPDDISLAWQLQCQHVWGARDKLGLSTISAPDTANKTDKLELIPDVKRILQSYIRYQMT